MRSATRGEDSERRAWDLNPRDFRLPVFKTGALGRYASPPWGNLPVGLNHDKINLAQLYRRHFARNPCSFVPWFKRHQRDVHQVGRGPDAQPPLALVIT